MTTDYDPKAPTRKQLESFLPDQELIRLFEQLFEKVPSDLTDLQDQVFEVAEAAGTAIAKSNALLATMTRVAEALETLSVAPPVKPDIKEDDISPPVGPSVVEDDVSPPTRPITTEDDVSPPQRSLIVLGDIVNVSDRGRSDKDLLIWNNTTKKWEANSTVTDGTTNLIASSATMTDNSGANTGTLTNSPVTGNPSKWVAVDDNGTTRYSPLW